VRYVAMSAKSSFLGSKFVVIPIKIYESTFWGAVHKFSVDQEFNADVPKALNAEDK